MRPPQRLRAGEGLEARLRIIRETSTVPLAESGVKVRMNSRRHGVAFQTSAIADGRERD
jgi:hypothetical protein